MKVLVAAVALGFFALTTSGNASPYVVTLQQNGSDVVASGSGQIDVTGLDFLVDIGSNFPAIDPSKGSISTGAIKAALWPYAASFTSGPSNFGPGPYLDATSGSGDPVGRDGGDILLPAGYTNESNLSSTGTWSNKTLAGLGVTPGDYIWTWGTGPDQRFELDVVAATAIPEPPSAALVVTGLVGLCLLGRRSKRKLVACAPKA